MTDIPFFTGAGGLSTLVLRDIPRTKTALAILRDCAEADLPAHLALCAGFCRSAGAALVYASLAGDRLLFGKAPDCALLQLIAPVGPFSGPLPFGVETLSHENADAFRDIYNRCFESVPGSARYDKKDVLALLNDGNRLGLLYRQGSLPIAMAELKSDGAAADLRAIAVLPERRGGTGGLVLAHLMGLAAKRGAQTLCVSVMSTNLPALNLYEKAGFTHHGVISTWFLI